MWWFASEKWRHFLPNPLTREEFLRWSLLNYSRSGNGHNFLFFCRVDFFHLELYCCAANVTVRKPFLTSCISFSPSPGHFENPHLVSGSTRSIFPRGGIIAVVSSSIRANFLGHLHIIFIFSGGGRGREKLKKNQNRSRTKNFTTFSHFSKCRQAARLSKHLAACS